MGFGTYDDSEQGKNEVDFDEDDGQEFDSMNDARHDGQEELEGTTEDMMDNFFGGDDEEDDN